MLHINSLVSLPSASRVIRVANEESILQYMATAVNILIGMLGLGQNLNTFMSSISTQYTTKISLNNNFIQVRNCPQKLSLFAYAKYFYIFIYILTEVIKLILFNIF